MSDKDLNTQETQEDMPSELSLLKARAKKMGIPIQGNPSVETLKKAIDERASANPEAGHILAKDEERVKRQEIRDKALKLRRVLITCMNPNKKSMQGEVVTVSNKVIGTVKKYIPYNPATHEHGYHIPECIYQMLKARKFQTFVEVKHSNGEKTMKGQLVSEFAISVLPPLTEKELADLAKAQAARSGM